MSVIPNGIPPGNGILSTLSSNSPLLTGLESYWILGEASGTRADSHGTNDLTPANTPGNTTGKITNALDLVSASSQYLTIASNSSITTGDVDWTFTSWVNIKNKAAAYLLFGKGDALSFSNVEFELYYSFSSDRFYFRVSDGSTYINLFANSFGSPSINTWYFVSIAHVASLSRIFISVNDGTVDSANIGAGAVPSSTGPFRIGARGNATDFANARVCEVGFWKRALTSAENTEVYNAGSGLAYPFS